MEIVKISWNVNALLGWFAVIFGWVGMAAQLLIAPSITGFAFSAFGLVGGAILVTQFGPLKTTTIRKIG